MSRCSAAAWTETHPVKQAPQWADSPVTSVRSFFLSVLSFPERVHCRGRAGLVVCPLTV